MSFDWKEYFVLAEMLLGSNDRSPDHEARYRGAISRAYYSVHGNVCKYLKTKGVNCPKEKRHSFVLIELEKIGRKTKNIRRDTRSLMDRRVDADYKENISITLQDAEYYLEIANDIHIELEKLNTV